MANPAFAAIKQQVEEVMEEVRCALHEKAQHIGPYYLDLQERDILIYCGKTYLATYGGRTPVTRALVALGYTRRGYQGEYGISVCGLLQEPYTFIQALPFYQSLAPVAASLLTERLQQQFYVNEYDS